MHPNNSLYSDLVKNRDLTDADVARLLRVSRSTAFRWRRGIIIPEDSKLMLLAEITGQTIKIGNETIVPQRVDDGEASVATLERDCLRSIKKLPTQKQREVWAAVRTIITAATPPVTYGATPTSAQPDTAPDPVKAAAQQIVAEAAARVLARGKGSPLR